MKSGATVRPDLADVAVEFSAGVGQFMGLQILPAYETSKKSGDFHKIAIAEATKPVGDLTRAPGSKYARVQHVTTTDSYTCVEYGLEEAIDDGDKAELSDYFDAEVDATNINVRNLLTKHESRVATLLFNATTFSGYTGGVTTEWDNSGNPFNDVQDALLTLVQNCGGVLGVGYEVCLAVSEKNRAEIVQNSNVKALLAGGQYGDKDFIGKVSNDQLARVLGVDKFFSSPAQENGSDIWDDEYALLFVRRNDRMLKSGIQLGRTFQWSGDHSGIYTVEAYREEQSRSDIVRVRHTVDEKVITTAAGYLLSNIHT